MNFKSNIWSVVFSKMMVIIIICCLSIKPIVQTYGLIIEPEYELIDIEGTEDHNDNEQDQIDKKIQIQISDYQINSRTKLFVDFVQVFNLNYNFILEIPIPPPNFDLV